MNEIRAERNRLRLEVAALKCRLLEIRQRQQELRKTETKKKMKESTPAPLKERKERRKEKQEEFNNNKNSKISFEIFTKEGPEEPRFKVPTLEEVQAYMNEKGETRFPAGKFWDYYAAKGWALGKSKMMSWQLVLDYWIKEEDAKAAKQSHKSGSKASQNIVTFNAYKPVETKGAVSYEEYKRMMREGKCLSPNPGRV